MLNSTMIMTIAEASGGLVSLAQILVGGFVGLYIISIIVTYYSNKRMRKLLIEIRDELKMLNKRK